MRVSRLFVILSAMMGFSMVATAAAVDVENARAEPLKRFSLPTEKRAQASARYEPRAPKPSARERQARAPHPSARSVQQSTKRVVGRRSVSGQDVLAGFNDMLCPFGTSACPVESVFALPTSLAEWSKVDHECVNFETDLQSCGGCPSIDIRHDCTSIKGAVNVACVSGGCQVQTCDVRSSVSADGKSCIPN